MGRPRGEVAVVSHVDHGFRALGEILEQGEHMQGGLRVESAQRPAGILQGTVMRVFGTRQVRQQMDRSLDMLAQRFRTG